MCSGSCGGISYVGVFGLTGTTYHPTFVFSDQLYCNAKYIADVTTHECGHALGLSHDGTNCQTSQGAASGYYQGQGTGPTSWAPVMGAAYYKTRAMWNAGDYMCANNQEDDLTIIAGKVPYRPDDYGNSCGSASALSLQADAPLLVAGVVERTGDNDTFAVQMPGPGWRLDLSVAVAARSADLDAQVTLLDAACAPVAVFNPADALDVRASTFVAAAAGALYVQITGVGAGDPLTAGYSRYGSLGQFTLNLTLRAPPPATAAALSKQAQSPTPTAQATTSRQGTTLLATTSAARRSSSLPKAASTTRQAGSTSSRQQTLRTTLSATTSKARSSTSAPKATTKPAKKKRE